MNIHAFRLGLLLLCLEGPAFAGDEVTINVTDPAPVSATIQFASGVDATPAKWSHAYVTLNGPEAEELFLRLSQSHPVTTGRFTLDGVRYQAETVQTAAVACQHFRLEGQPPVRATCHVTINYETGLTEPAFLPTTDTGGTGIAGVRTN